MRIVMSEKVSLTAVLRPLVIAGELLKLGAELIIQEQGKIAAQQNSADPWFRSAPQLLDAIAALISAGAR
jgi:hypothetical protein